MILLTFILILLFSISAAMADTKDAGIIHDGEYNFLKAQHGEKWAAEDKEAVETFMSWHPKE
jgi:hypothetical protein